MHPIRYVAHLTGLTPHVIRAWERRYGAVAPLRTETNRRLYSERDIERLQLLQKAVRSGHAIGQLAQLTDDELLQLLKNEKTSRLTRADPGLAERSPLFYYESCVSTLVTLDGSALETSLRRAAIDLSRHVLIEEVIAPLLRKLGDLWSEGSVKTVHEHMASSVIRTFLGEVLLLSTTSGNAPNLIATTPVGQLHELGALMAAVAATSEGWRATYLGPNLPAEEIASGSRQTRARVVALSIVYPADDPRLVGELERLSRYLSDDIGVIVGGRAAGAYNRTLEATAAIQLEDMAGLRRKLAALRSSGSF
jgi:DNA-binding transcriptional MerR regulator/methylmalonyl-CoA mutase cobalamin-binding subunit